MPLGLPDLRDGLTPCGRRMLLATLKAEASSDPDTVNTYKALHAAWDGDHAQSFDELFAQLLRLTQPWVCRYPLIEPGGYFGSVDGATASPAYYTRVQLTRIGRMLVGATPHATLEDPGVLPSSFPQLLCNGALAHTGVIDLDCESANDPGPEPPAAYYRVPTGRMVGGKLEAFLPPHHLGRVCEGLVYMADHPGAQLGQMLPIIRGPDFPTGGLLMNPEDLERIYAEGEGVLKLRARTKVTKDSDGNDILVIQELPYGVTTGELLPWLIREGAVDVGVTRPENDPAGYRVQIRVKADPAGSALEDMSWTVLKRETKVRLAVVCDGKAEVITLLQLMKWHLESMRKLLGLRSDNQGRLHEELRRWIEQGDNPRTEISMP